VPSPIYAIAFSQSKRTDFESGRQANAFAGLGKGAVLIARATGESSTLPQ
jgi:hypothetical protein